jgi:hypothetical protein
MNRSILALALVMAATVAAAAQSPYPFTDTEGNRDILAYWYNVPKSENRGFYSTLQILGMAKGDGLKVTAAIYDRSGTKVLEKAFTPVDQSEANASATASGGIKGDGAFYIECEVPQQKESPAKIVVTVESAEGKRVKEIACRYHRIRGTITDFDGEPVKAYISFGPDGFSGQIGVWGDAEGHYEIEVPERTYNTVQVNNDNYKKTILEPWGWHVVVDRDERMDFKIGTAEIYNLKAWSNNYSKKAFLLSFRPMTLANCPRLYKKYQTEINGAKRDVIDIAPELDATDVRVTINGRPATVLSVQRYYETGDKYTMPAYIVQVSGAGIDTRDKTTFVVEYDKTIECEGKQYRCTSMALYQERFGRLGFSPYY